MPRFQLMPVDEALMKASTGKRALINREYLGYIERLEAGQAGHLEVSAGETVGGIRRRLSAAAKAAGKDLTIKRAGDAIFFWVKGQEAGTASRRRGRPRKATSEG